MSGANFLHDHFPVRHVLAEVMQLNRKVLRSWAKFVSIREFKCADVVFENSASHLGFRCVRKLDTKIMNFLNQVNEVWLNRRSGNSHDLLREFVNSIMNNLFMTPTVVSGGLYKN